ncbi:MAG: response regulator transcription factor [Pirellulales bacterium]|nr:response regulator transcription factor [Pirellulales bacterium]
MSRKKIIIVEDERDMAELISARLKREHFEPIVAYDGPEGLRQIFACVPDLVILDIMLPGMSGMDVLKELRAHPQTLNIPVILLTAKSEEGDIVAGLQIGADDYITKPFSMSVLIARIYAVLRRHAAAYDTTSRALALGPISIDRDQHRVAIDGVPISLTLTEFRLLTALVGARGRVLTRDQLMDRAMGIDAMVTDRTVDVHLAALRRKLGSARRYIQTVRGLGYRVASEINEVA